MTPTANPDHRPTTSLLPSVDTLRERLGRRSHAQLLWLLQTRDPGADAEIALAPVLTSAAGGRVLWQGRSESLLIGADPVAWTHVVLTEGAVGPLLAAAETGASSDALGAVAVYLVNPQQIPAPLRWLFRALRPLGRLLEREPREALAHRPAAMDEADINPPMARLERLADDPRTGRTTMVNLLEFRPQADYAGVVGADPKTQAANAGRTVSGRAAYMRYGLVAARSVAMVGGDMEFLGRLGEPLLDRAGLATSGAWHDLAVVHYPAPSSIVKLEAMPGYARAVTHRSASVARTVILVCR